MPAQQDINGDKRDDFVVGGTAHHGAKIGYQQPDGTFLLDSMETKESEDIGLLLFDADSDGDLDLYCVSGSSEFGRSVAHYQGRLYRNDGEGRFTLDASALPKIESSGSCVSAADIDHDQDLDLFVGGRVVPQSYPLPPRSYVLRNNGGNFEDVTAQIAPGLDSLGMVTAAAFSDIDNDGWSDLMVVGEWMPITVFTNKQGTLSMTREYQTGWWNSIAPGDFDSDGDTDFIVGNLGLNSVLQTSEQKPVSIYAKDFDGNGSIDPFISRYNGDKEYPVHYRETMTEQIASLRKILKRYADYGKMEMRDILTFLGNKDVFIRRATNFQSSYLENVGAGAFALHSLPGIAQASPLMGVAVSDINGDGHADFLGVGNSFSEEPVSGYYDAGIGVCALGKGDGTFEFMTPGRSGFSIRTDAKAIVPIVINGSTCWIITSNQAPLMMFRKRQPNQPFRAAR